ncbi:hypothetical protein MRB53_003415 [Persea americana]|uniref:Uncharacterized protein n=1 Tax=Persea americana TaxID=3435 RepID=A0ACC2MX98_PERAE|nr:hypothetical protein MRB53_003415 [Persea americana]
MVLPKDWARSLQTGTSYWIPHPPFSSHLKKIGTDTSAQQSLPAVREDDASFLPTPRAILDHRVPKGHQEVLIHWQGLSPADATWENLQNMKRQFTGLALEEDKGQIRGVELLRA